MAWRVHLADDSIYRLDILKGQPDVLCAWFAGDRVAFYELTTGTALGRAIFEPPAISVSEREGEEWRDFLATLQAPNGVPLPTVRLQRLTIQQSMDGKRQLYDDGHGVSVCVDGQETPLSAADTHLSTVALNPHTGVVVALDDRGKIYLFTGEREPQVVDLRLQPEAHTVPDLVMANEADLLIVTDGYHLVRVGANGEIDRRRQMAYYINRIACASDGERCATSDSEAGIIRVYTGPELTFERQKYAIDLYVAADPVQLMENLPTPRLAVSAMALDGDMLAFAMEGMITATHLSQMTLMPQAQSPL
jgi:hypothetical protein